MLISRPLLTRSHLDAAFNLYVRELRQVREHRCCEHRCYYSALHLLAAIPDVCGALASDDGVSTAQKYKGWCERHLPSDPRMKPADWWKMRCALLHVGSSLPTDKRGEQSQYDSISFFTPEQPGRHREVSPGGSGKNISLNIADLANEMLTGLDSWFNWVLASATEAGKVATRLHRVISPRPKVYPDAPEDVHTVLSSTGTMEVWHQRFS